MNIRQFHDKRQKKREGIGELTFGKKTKEFMRFLNSQSLLEFLQELTSIEETLIGDPIS